MAAGSVVLSSSVSFVRGRAGLTRPSNEMKLSSSSTYELSVLCSAESVWKSGEDRS